MKISKLFHWLYAVVMLLPIFAIGVTCGYAMFNKNAYKSYSGTASYITTQNVFTYFSSSEKTETTEQTINNVVHYKASNHNFSGEIESINHNQYSMTTSNAYTIINISNLVINNTEYPTIKSIVINKSGNNVNLLFQLFEYTYDFNNLYVANINVNESAYFNEVGNVTYNRASFKMLISNSAIQNNNFSFINNEENIYYQVDNSNLKNFEKNIFYSDSNLSNVFYYSIDKVQQSPLFNWAENSFLVTPFAYIVSLFSMPTNSPIVMFLSYWLAISIIWLVFDLIMYVPLLVHRWLDKGVLE